MFDCLVTRSDPSRSSGGLPQHPPPGQLALRREPAPLRVRPTQLALPKLLLDDAILLEEGLDRPVPPAMHPGRDGELQDALREVGALWTAEYSGRVDPGRQGASIVQWDTTGRIVW